MNFSTVLLALNEGNLEDKTIDQLRDLLKGNTPQHQKSELTIAFGRVVNQYLVSTNDVVSDWKRRIVDLKREIEWLNREGDLYILDIQNMTEVTRCNLRLAKEEAKQVKAALQSIKDKRIALEEEIEPLTQRQRRLEVDNIIALFVDAIKYWQYQQYEFFNPHPFQLVNRIVRAVFFGFHADGHHLEMLRAKEKTLASAHNYFVRQLTENCRNPDVAFKNACSMYDVDRDFFRKIV